MIILFDFAYLILLLKYGNILQKNDVFDKIIKGFTMKRKSIFIAKYILIWLSIFTFFIYCLFFFGSQYRINGNDGRCSEIIKINLIIGLITLFVQLITYLYLFLFFKKDKDSLIETIVLSFLFMFVIVTMLVRILL